jgi:hypothetical protein
LLVAATAPVAFGQHSDIEFEYEGDTASPTGIEIEAGEFNSAGFMFFESEFEIGDPGGDPDNYFTTNPGFETHDALNPNDSVWIRFLDASTVDTQYGEGYVNFLAQGSTTIQAFGEIGITDNTGATMDLILDGDSVNDTSFVRQWIDDADDNDGHVHKHLTIIDLLDDDTPFGTYGIMFQLESDLADGSGTVLSEEAWLFFNHGQSEAEFEGSLASFGVIPEPSSTVLIAVAGVAMVSRRRRRS